MFEGWLAPPASYRPIRNQYQNFFSPSPIVSTLPLISHEYCSLRTVQDTFLDPRRKYTIVRASDREKNNQRSKYSAFSFTKVSIPHTATSTSIESLPRLDPSPLHRILPYRFLDRQLLHRCLDCSFNGYLDYFHALSSTTPITFLRLLPHRNLDRSSFIATSTTTPAYTSTHTISTMVKRNIVIAIIIILLFVVLAAVGYVIYGIQNRISLFGRRRIIEVEDEDV